jgi:hypothetical protein
MLVRETIIPDRRMSVINSTNIYGCFCEQRTGLDELFCQGLNNRIVYVKYNRISKGRLQQTDIDQGRLAKDGESIVNNNGRQEVYFFRLAFDARSRRCDDFVSLTSSDFVNRISWFSQSF